MYVEIARRLNRVNVTNHDGRPWTDVMIEAILKNENYVGNLVYKRTSRRLGQKLVNNPHHLWVRSAAAVDPMVEQDLFARAKKSWPSGIFASRKTRCCVGCD
ncbi:hypothetical protein V1278_002590 [Bradyrhizobium sp. AZCC 1577]